MSQIVNEKKVLVNNGKNYWRSLDEVAKTDEFVDFLQREFPQDATEVPDSLTRRSFGKILAAGAALSGAVLAPSCRRPQEKILPYAKAPEDVIPGKPLFYATSSPRTDGSIGLLVKSNEGRPTKIDGLPNHPINNGKTDQFAQADILDIYDPCRLQHIYFEKNGEVNLPSYKRPIFFGVQQLSKYDKIKNIKARDVYRAEIQKANKKGKDYLKKFINKAQDTQGEGLAILVAPTTSDAEKKVYKALQVKLPRAKVYFYEAINDDNSSNALKIAYHRQKYDRKLNYHFDKAQIVLSLDGDFLGNDANRLHHITDFVKGKKIDHNGHDKLKNTQVNRLYSVEANYSLTGANADHRLRLQSAKIKDFIFILANELIGKVAFDTKIANIITKSSSSLSDNKTLNFAKEVAKDLVENRGKSLIYVGERQETQVHLMALLINIVLDNLNKTFDIRQKVTETIIAQQEALDLLVNSMRNNEVSQMLILGGNPVFEVQTNKFANLLKNIKDSIHLTSMLNDTSVLTTCAIPQAHYLESWGDTRAYDGTKCFVQPLIRPLYNGMTNLEILAYLSDYKYKKSYDIVKEDYNQDDWQKLIHQGFVSNSAYKSELQSSINYDKIEREIRKSQKEVNISNAIELNLVSDYSVYDGRYSNNGWLQELPDPITKLTWDNALLIGHTTAQQKNLKNQQVVELKVGQNSIEVPVWIVPGIAHNAVSLALGYGQKTIGAVGKNVGFNSFSLFKENKYFVSCELTTTNKTYPLANTQDHGSMEDRPIIKETSFDKFKENPLFAKNQVNLKEPSLFPEREELLTAPLQWGMVIDLNSCIGCAVCTVACQAENNIAIVGKEQVIKGREMHWIRMDRYFTTPKKDDNDKIIDDEVGVVHMPMPCMQCEKAPCEQVCPVAATTHTAEGLNDMTYNRCIGTRYCLNNCPFKVRRFNYFNYQEDLKEPNNEVRRMVHNPNVTVRSRGVMEKCTYCVQRISEAKIDAKVHNNGILPEFTTACAQACPANAIVFGNIKDEKSAVAHQKAQSRRYELLPELNIRPRTSFLAQVRNTNKNLVKESLSNER